MDKRNNKLQELCRNYLKKLRPLAQKFGLDGFVDDTIEMNLQEKCKATEEEVKLLSRACDDERIARHDIPKYLGKSYRKCFEDGDFDNSELCKLRHVGIYSKVSAMLYAVTHGGNKQAN